MKARSGLVAHVVEVSRRDVVAVGLLPPGLIGPAVQDLQPLALRGDVDPGEVRFDEVKTSGDSPRPSQRQCEFVELALDHGRRLEQFTVIRVPKIS